MRLDYINPFIDAATSVLTMLTGMPVERGTMELRRDASATKEVMAVIGMAGEVEGRVILEMNNDTALAMAGIMNQEPFEELSHLAQDTLMELTNLVVAKAVSMLNEQGFLFKLTPPLIFTGANLSTASMNLETLVIRLHASAGEMNLNVALRMNKL